MISKQKPQNPYSDFMGSLMHGKVIRTNANGEWRKKGEKLHPAFFAKVNDGDIPVGQQIRGC